MARPSKLTETQCEYIRLLHAEDVNAPKLAKVFQISESSVYKILNGSYVAASEEDHQLPPLVKNPENRGSTPSIFNLDSNDGYKVTPEDVIASARVLRAAEANLREPVDEVTLAAAELVLAQARYAQALSRKR